LLFLFLWSTTALSSTLSLHDALPIYDYSQFVIFLKPSGPTPVNYNPKKKPRGGCNGTLNDCLFNCLNDVIPNVMKKKFKNDAGRSEEHTSELQSRFDIVCRLLLEKKT